MDLLVILHLTLITFMHCILLEEWTVIHSSWDHLWTDQTLYGRASPEIFWLLFCSINQFHKPTKDLEVFLILMKTMVTYEFFSISIHTHPVTLGLRNSLLYHISDMKEGWSMMVPVFKSHCILTATVQLTIMKTAWWTRITCSDWGHPLWWLATEQEVHENCPARTANTVQLCRNWRCARAVFKRMT